MAYSKCCFWCLVLNRYNITYNNYQLQFDIGKPKLKKSHLNKALTLQISTSRPCTKITEKILEIHIWCLHHYSPIEFLPLFQNIIILHWNLGPHWYLGHFPQEGKMEVDRGGKKLWNDKLSGNIKWPPRSMYSMHYERDSSLGECLSYSLRKWEKSLFLGPTSALTQWLNKMLLHGIRL